MIALRERRVSRLAVAAIVLALVALVALARYYAAGMHAVYFAPQTVGALARYLGADYAGAAVRLGDYLAAHPGADAQDDPSYPAFLRGDLDAAERSARDILRADPGATRAGITLAQTLLARERSGEALERLQSLIAAAPEKPINTLALAAIVETRLGRHQQAIALWQRALRYGEPGTRLSVYVAALGTAARLLREPPYPGRDALLAQIFCYLHYFDRGMAGTARRHAEAAIARGEQPASAWIALGILHARSHDADAALIAFERAAQIDPGSGQAHYHLARAYSDRGDLAGELRSALAGYAAQPDPQSAQWLLELLAGKFGDYRRALLIGQQRVAQGLREYGVLFEMGRAYGALGDYPAAIDAYARALEMQPNDANAMAHLAYWNAKAGRRAEAIAEARRAAAARRDWGYPLRVVARALAEDFRYAEAIPAYEQAFAVEKPAADDLAHLCTLYHGVSRWQQGLECFQSVLNRDPNNARARRMLGEAQNNLALAKRRQTEGKR